MFGENKYFTCTRYNNNLEWLQERQKSFGGSDIAAILGISKWQSPTSLYLEKTSDKPVEEDNPSPIQQFGHIMEPIIADAFKKHHPDILVRRANAILRPINKDYVHASLDFECKEPDGTWGVLEIKCASSESEWKNGVPAYYMVQGQHYLYVTNRTYVWFAVFFRDSCEIKDYRIERNDKMIDEIESAADAFHECVIKKTPPTNMSGTDDESSALAKLYKNVNDTLITTNDGKIFGAVITYETLSDQIKDLEKQKKQISNFLCSEIGNNRGLLVPNAHKKVVWVRSERTTYNTSKLMLDHPELMDDYSSTKTVSNGIRISDTK